MDKSSLNEGRRDFLRLTAGALITASIPFGADASPVTSTKRTIINFNRDWRFKLGDIENAHTVHFDSSQWDTIGLPHSFSIPYFLSPEFYIGYGWYRKQFTVPQNILGKCLTLNFEGAFQHTEVFINGVLAGTHSGGYNGFPIDITKAVVPGENTIAVRVNNLWDPRVAPRGGEHVFSGGIYRNVYLVITDPLHVAWYGTFITTPEVSKSSAVIHVKTEIQNDSSHAKQCLIKTEITDPNGKMVASIEATQEIKPNTVAVFDQTIPSISNPKLWHPDHPHMYRALTTVYDGKVECDTYETPFGIRWFKWTADKGFFLNGEHYYFCGANVHQDHAGWGDAVTNAGFARDVRFVKEAGMTFIRGSHYPKSPAFADECDKQGVLFWSENCFWGTGGPQTDGNWMASAYPVPKEDQPGFEESVKNSLREMIRINRNHPSIIAWSMGNETFFSRSEIMSEMREFLKELIPFCHKLDPTRPAAIGGVQRGEIDHIGDIAGYNGDGAKLFINTGVANVVSEYGSTICDRPGAYEPGWGDLPEVPDQDKTQKYPWRYTWRSGEVIWCAFDHGSIFGHFGSMGFVDYFRIPKRQWYWYRNEYKQIPPPEWPSNDPAASIHLSSDKPNIMHADGTDDVQILITMLGASGKPVSATPIVTLIIDSGPGEFPTGKSITFAPDSDIAIRDGQAAIEMRAYYAGKTVIRATSAGLPDSTITIESIEGPRYTPGKVSEVKERPYHRYSNKDNALQVFNSALLRPTLASSDRRGHPSMYANDGDASTSWMAENLTPNQWWMVDMEGSYNVNVITFQIPDNGQYEFLIEKTDDKKSWTKIADQTAMESKNGKHILKLNEQTTASCIRITFTKIPADKRAAISDCQIMSSRSY